MNKKVKYNHSQMAKEKREKKKEVTVLIQYDEVETRTFEKEVTIPEDVYNYLKKEGFCDASKKYSLDDDFDKLLINDMQNDVFNHKYDLHLRRNRQPNADSYINDYYEVKYKDIFGFETSKENVMKSHEVVAVKEYFLSAREQEAEYKAISKLLNIEPIESEVE